MHITIHPWILEYWLAVLPGTYLFERILYWSCYICKLHYNPPLYCNWFIPTYGYYCYPAIRGGLISLWIKVSYVLRLWGVFPCHVRELALAWEPLLMCACKAHQDTACDSGFTRRNTLAIASLVYHDASLPSGGRVWICMQKHSETTMCLSCAYLIL